MRKIFQTACILGALMASPAYAFDYIDSHVPNAEKVGEGRLTYFIWNVYDAELYAPDGKWEKDKPFALRLSYLMNLDGGDIADRSIEEIRKQGFDDEEKLKMWHTQMKRIFPDVNETTTLTGIYKANGETAFYENGYGLGRISDPEFGRYFFDIWLGEQTSAPKLTQQLLGVK